jgi:putative ABC transport system ATP-binding protein
MKKSPLIVIRSVSKTYWRGKAAIEALRSVSLEVSDGELVLVTGRSGSGKTTLLNLVAALDRPDTGEILIENQDIAHLSPTAAAKFRNSRVGIVFQSYNLLPQLTALENVLLPMVPKGRLDRRLAREWLEAVGLGGRAEHRPAELSGGEQQRVAIARSFANDPALILADEPTGNLDDENARNVVALLCRSCRERGKTLILVTHDSHAIPQPDAVFELQNGMLQRGERSFETPLGAGDDRGKPIIDRRARVR